jgi:hypothetical protein
MKTRLALSACAATVLLVAGVASAQETYRTAQPTASSNADTMQQSGMPQQNMQSANVQDSSNADSSYGGVPATRSAMGGGSSNVPCTRGPQCNIFFGQ